MQHHLNSTEAARQYFSPKSITLQGKEADEYRALKAQVKESIEKHYFIDDKYWNTRLVMDQLPLGNNLLILHDFAPSAAAATSIRDKLLSAPAQTVAEMHYALARHWLHNDASLLRPDRPAFMASVYTQPEALAVLKAHYDRRDIGKILSVLPSEQYFAAWEQLFPEAQPVPAYPRSAWVNDSLAVYK